MAEAHETLAKGLGVAVGEIALGVNGPFIFCRFGLYVPIAVATALVIGAALGYFIVSVVQWAGHKAPAITPITAAHQELQPR